MAARERPWQAERTQQSGIIGHGVALLLATLEGYIDEGDFG